MKHFLLILLGVAVAAGVVFVLFSRPAGQPVITPLVDVLPQVGGNIIVTEPKPGAVIVGTSILVEGRARTFEQTVNWRLRAGGGAELSTGYTTATAVDIGTFGDFSFNIAIPDGAPAELVVEVFEVSAKDGTEVSKVSIPVTHRL